MNVIATKFHIFHCIVFKWTPHYNSHIQSYTITTYNDQAIYHWIILAARLHFPSAMPPAEGSCIRHSCWTSALSRNLILSVCIDSSILALHSSSPRRFSGLLAFIYKWLPERQNSKSAKVSIQLRVSVGDPRGNGKLGCIQHSKIYWSRLSTQRWREQEVNFRKLLKTISFIVNSRRRIVHSVVMKKIYIGWAEGNSLGTCLRCFNQKIYIHFGANIFHSFSSLI